MAIFSIRAAPLPLSFKGSPQEFFDAMLDRIEVVSEVTNFVIQDSDPGINLGPWLKGGKRWYVWDNVTNPSGAYVPVDISDSLNDEIVVTYEDPDVPNTPYGIADYEDMVPPKVAPRIWFQTSVGSTELRAIWYNFGGSLGWVKGPATAVSGSLPLTALAAQGVEKAGWVLAVSGDGLTIAPKEITISRLANPTNLEANKMVIVNPDGNGFMYASVSTPTVKTAQNTVSVAASPTFSYPHGLSETPKLVRAVLVCLSTDLSYDVGDEVSIESVALNTPEQQASFVVGANITSVWAATAPAGGNSLKLFGKGATSGSNMNLACWAIKIYYQ